MPLDKSSRLGITPYYTAYFNYLGAGFAIAKGETVQSWDALVDDVNARVQKILQDSFTASGNPRRLTIVDMNALVRNYDAKHARTNVGTSVILHGYELTNWPLAGYPTFPHAGGGIFSADNMHLSTIGYSLMATQVLASIAESEGGPVHKVDLNALYQRDRNGVFPGLSQLSWASQIFRDYRAAKAGHQSAPETTTTSSASFVAVKSVFEILTAAGVIH
jgi:hypothetical protein